MIEELNPCQPGLFPREGSNTLRSNKVVMLLYLQYGGELVRRICSSKTDGRGAALRCLPN